MKARLLKLLFTMVAVLTVTAAFSQTYPGNLINSGAVTTPVDSVTEGQPIPYYVEPDPVLNPGYTGTYPGGSGSLSQTEEWNWWLGTEGTVGGAFNASQGTAGGDADQDGPYIEATWNDPNAGVGAPVEDTIFVQENNSNIGSCGGDTSFLRALVFDAPAFTPIDNGDADPTTDAFIELCGSQQYNINLSSIADNHVTTGNLKIRLDSITVDNVSASAPQGGSTGNIRADEDTVVIWAGTPVDGAGGAETGQTLLTNYDIDVKNNAVTRYRFVFAEDGNSNGTLTDGISDQISRKSDYLAVGGSDPADEQQWTYYAATDAGAGTTKDIVVYPKPNTGNIYYVPHDFDQ
mgnify:CR=1 FL=1